MMAKKNNEAKEDEEYGLSDKQKERLRLEDSILNGILRDCGIKYLGTPFMQDANKI